jgi:transcriptional regulator GlxA family with amidase domain
MALEQLRELGASPTPRRIVEQDKVITAAGVSSGIDMALTLAARIAGDEIAQAIQLRIEYDPQPPFSAGSPQTAPPHVVEKMRERMRHAWRARPAEPRGPESTEDTGARRSAYSRA